MGKRGPKPGNSQIYPPKTPGKPPKPPVGMSSRPRRIWKNLVASLPANHFQASDFPLLRAYCEAEALHFEASEKIGREGAVLQKYKEVDGANVAVGVRTSPWVAIQTQTAHTMAQLATKLRLCANARLSPDEAGRTRPPNAERRGLLFGEEEWQP